MARAQSQYLRIYDTVGTYQRWQSYYSNTTVTWDGAQWQYQPFEADGITAGQTGDESGVSVTLPANTLAIDAVTAALANARMVELKIYEFDTLNGNTTPQAGQTLVAAFAGEVIGASGSFISITMELGSSLSPVGAQIPPRTLTTRLMGKGCRL